MPVIELDNQIQTDIDSFESIIIPTGVVLPAVPTINVLNTTWPFGFGGLNNTSGDAANAYWVRNNNKLYPKTLGNVVLIGTDTIVGYEILRVAGNANINSLTINGVTTLYNKASYTSDLVFTEHDIPDLKAVRAEITASIANIGDNILEWGGTSYKPYNGPLNACFYTGLIAPTHTDVTLNYDGIFRATNILIGDQQLPPVTVINNDILQWNDVTNKYERYTPTFDISHTIWSFDGKIYGYDGHTYMDANVTMPELTVASNDNPGGTAITAVIYETNTALNSSAIAGVNASTINGCLATGITGLASGNANTISIGVYGEGSTYGGKFKASGVNANRIGLVAIGGIKHAEFGEDNNRLTILNSGVAEYAQDYSALYTTRSLVDKAYVDNSSNQYLIDRMPGWVKLTVTTIDSFNGNPIIPDVAIVVTNDKTGQFYTGKSDVNGDAIIWVQRSLHSIAGVAGPYTQHTISGMAPNYGKFIVHINITDPNEDINLYLNSHLTYNNVALGSDTQILFKDGTEIVGTSSFTYNTLEDTLNNGGIIFSKTGFQIAKDGSDTINGGARYVIGNGSDQYKWVQQLNSINGINWFYCDDGTISTPFEFRNNGILIAKKGSASTGGGTVVLVGDGHSTAGSAPAYKFDNFKPDAAKRNITIQPDSNYDLSFIFYNGIDWGEQMKLSKQGKATLKTINLNTPSGYGDSLSVTNEATGAAISITKVTGGGQALNINSALSTAIKIDHTGSSAIDLTFFGDTDSPAINVVAESGNGCKIWTLDGAAAALELQLLPAFNKASVGDGLYIANMSHASNGIRINQTTPGTITTGICINTGNTGLKRGLYISRSHAENGDMISLDNSVSGAANSAMVALLNTSTTAMLLKAELNGVKQVVIKGSGYTQLGDLAPAIKTKKLTGTTAATQGGNAGVAHGLTGDKIISFTLKITHAVNNGVPAQYEYEPQYKASIIQGDTNFIVQNIAGNSSGILSKPFTIYVTYEE